MPAASIALLVSPLHSCLSAHCIISIPFLARRWRGVLRAALCFNSFNWRRRYSISFFEIYEREKFQIPLNKGEKKKNFTYKYIMCPKKEKKISIIMEMSYLFYPACCRLHYVLADRQLKWSQHRSSISINQEALRPEIYLTCISWQLNWGDLRAAALFNLRVTMQARCLSMTEQLLFNEPPMYGDLNTSSVWITFLYFRSVLNYVLVYLDNTIVFTNKQSVQTISSKSQMASLFANQNDL